MKYMRLVQSFFERDAANVAPELAGKVLCRRTDAGVIKRKRQIQPRLQAS